MHVRDYREGDCHLCTNLRIPKVVVKDERSRVFDRAGGCYGVNRVNTTQIARGNSQRVAGAGQHDLRHRVHTCRTETERHVWHCVVNTAMAVCVRMATAWLLGDTAICNVPRSGHKPRFSCSSQFRDRRSSGYNTSQVPLVNLHCATKPTDRPPRVDSPWSRTSR